MKAVPKTIKPSRITSAAISLPFHWNALLAAELVEADEAEVDDVVAEVVEAVRVDCELEAVDEADVDVVVADHLHVWRQCTWRAGSGVEKVIASWELFKPSPMLNCSRNFLISGQETPHGQLIS
jgi:hypothetical protein